MSSDTDDRHGTARAAVLGLIMLGACEALPPLDYQSEHALVGTDVVDRVCAGSLARIDWTIEYVDETLGLRTGGEPARIYVLEREQVYERCHDVVGGCAWRGDVFITRRSFDRAIVHELVHDRIGRTAAWATKIVFQEGIAEAIGEVGRPPRPDSPRSTVNEYISANTSSALAGHRGYFYAGELVHWLIETHGIEKVLAFMADVGWASSAATVRERYMNHFGSRIDDDFFAHIREEEDLTRANVICTGPEIPVDPQRRRIHLQADFACDSPRVENNFVFRDRVYVEWVVEIAEQQAGLWAPVRWTDDGALPRGTLLEIEACRREHRRRRTWSSGRNPPVTLEPGLYRIRWHGPMDGHELLDLELGGPCDEIAQDCEAGERCVSPGLCVPLP